MAIFADFAKSSFFTVPDWRYLRARELFDRGIKRGSSKTDDSYTLANLKLLRRLEGQSKCQWTPELEMLHAAHLLHLKTEYHTIRLEVECRILAGFDDAEICRLVAMPPGLLEAYERTFFDIRNRLDGDAYVHSIVLKTQLGELRQDTDQMLRYLAYTVGPSVIDLLMLAYRATRPEQRVALLREIGDRAANTPEIESLFRQDASQPMCEAISNLLSSFGVRLKDHFPLDGVDASEVGLSNEFSENLRHVG